MEIVPTEQYSLTLMGGTQPVAQGYDPNEPDFVTDSSRRMYERSRLCRILDDGIPSIRRQASYFLPKFPNEDDEDYKVRVEFMSVRNFYAQALNSMIGKIFAQPPRLKADVPTSIAADLEDADLQGRHWTMVAGEFLRTGINEGMSWLFVDYHALPEDVIPQLTLADEMALGLRPYWFVVPASRFLGARYRKVGNVFFLTQVRFIQYVEVESGEFGSEWVEEVMVYRPDEVRAFRRAPQGSVNSGKWEVYSRAPNTLGRIPAVPLVLDRVGRYEAKPPLENLAHMVKEHVQIRSDQRRALSVASFPLLVTAGVEAAPGERTKIGPMNSIMLEDSNASVKWVESQGRHLEQGRSELKDLEDAIRVFGLAFENPSAYATATGRNIDASDAIAPIQNWAHMLRDALEVALQLHADWRRLPSGGSVDMNVSFLRNQISVEELKILVEALKEGAITPRGFLTRLKEYGLLSEDFDVEKDVEEALRIAEDAQKKLVEAKAAARPADTPPAQES